MIERPCDLCRTLTLEDILEDVSELCACERHACPECVSDLEAERAHEERVADFDARQVEYWR